MWTNFCCFWNAHSNQSFRVNCIKKKYAKSWWEKMKHVGDSIDCLSNSRQLATGFCFVLCIVISTGFEQPDNQDWLGMLIHRNRMYKFFVVVVVTVYYKCCNVIKVDDLPVDVRGMLLDLDFAIEIVYSLLPSHSQCVCVCVCVAFN